MLAVMGFGSLMTIVTVSLSTIADDLGTSRATLGWVVTGLMLAMAVATPLAGKLGDIHGHRRVFLWGLGMGVVTTALCALAWNAGSLIAFRVLFGISGALVMPNGMSLVMRAYGPERRATAMGWFQFAMTGAPTVGLVVGGPLIDVVGWRPLFYAFAVVSVIALVVGAAVVRESPRQERVPLDVAGALALGGAVLCGLLAVTQGAGSARDDGVTGILSDASALLLALGAVLGVALFIRIESRATPSHAPAAVLPPPPLHHPAGRQRSHPVRLHGRLRGGPAAARRCVRLDRRRHRPHHGAPAGGVQHQRPAGRPAGQSLG